MNCTWTLHVENFAKIKSADIQISPLLCLVGDNNSGKSYMMSLIWGILNLGRELFPKKPPESKKYKECEHWLAKNIGGFVEITDDIADMYLEWFNELLNSQKKALLRKIFNYDVNIGVIRIDNLKRRRQTRLEWDDYGERFSARANHIQFPSFEVYTKSVLLKMNSYLCWNLIMDGLAAPMLTPRSLTKRFGEPVYLPASRTGFMLTYGQLLSNSLQTSFSIYAENDETEEANGGLTPRQQHLLLRRNRSGIKKNIEKESGFESSPEH